MIDIKVKIHDKFSFEFKTSFIATRKSKMSDTNEFSINMWMFVPNSLDINRSTYSKDQFYRDTKSNVRLITPVYSLKDIYNGDQCPLSRLRASIEELKANPEDQNSSANYAYQVRMFSSIFKSASRDRAYFITDRENDDEIAELIAEYISEISDILLHYRKLSEIMDEKMTKDNLQYFSFGDDFIGNIAEQNAYRIMRRLSGRPVYESIKNQLLELVKKEDSYKNKKGYSQLDPKDPTNNYLVVMRRGILKKFIESDLYLNTKSLKDGALAQQFYYGIAAGVSMVFATVVAFTAQQRYGNFTVPLFFALVVSYIFKDRIKDLMRYYFSTQLGKKYFDNKRELEIQKQKIGWSKEAFDFVSEEKIPEKVMNIRKRSPLVEAESKIYNEQIILYKKLVQLSSTHISQYKGYRFVGINDITRFNLTNFIQKMDNPFVPLCMPDEKNGYILSPSEKVYALHIVLRCQGHSKLYYRKFRLLFNREGIKDITEINSTPDLS
ncbi:hypothetical protein [Dysgonomonas sp. 520]|uniref:hypothetical protein n=1 Tax=Dysgonomonas sp. 520 TaxID=2302931 RepID=UPI0013D8A51A|nr:hypothetical protein [Dysgonomonas sp. 520]NDW10049.1 hypothetical protein [Dysgonomonas sp. 520]